MLTIESDDTELRLEAKKSLDSLIEQFIKWSSVIKPGEVAYGCQRIWLRSECGSFYIRNMGRGISSGRPELSLASLEVEPLYQSKGMLGGFISFLEKGEHPFVELEIENITTKRLLNYALNNGFNVTQSASSGDMVCETVVRML